MYLKSYNLILVVCIFSFFTIKPLAIIDPYRTNMIIFSYDRPLQLHTLLQSLETYVTGLNNVYVIYKTSSTEFADAYNVVASQFSSVTFLKQLINQDLIVQLTLALADVTTDYYVLAVDDTIVKDSFNIKTCAQYLNSNSDAYGFYFSLGTHLNYCYPYDTAQSVPSYTVVNGTNKVYKWTFVNGTYDWNYPNSVNMVLYRKLDITPIITLIGLLNLTVNTPSDLCGVWQEQVPIRTSGLFFQNSKAVNIPFNKVNFLYDNRYLNTYSAQDFLTLYNQGKIIDISPLHQISNNAIHIDFTPTFIDY